MNRLIHEKSPYLLQHAHNPVDWYPWGEEAFAKARQEQKPIFLSIGYSTCHWCHVMERESFENPAIAQLLNQSFVSIKVDREEHPDLDQVYMRAVTMLTDHGGWPLTVVLTPDLKPFYGGTYFPPQRRWNLPGMTELLPAIAQAWSTKRESLEQSAEQLTRALHERVVKTEVSNPLTPELLDAAFTHARDMFDQIHGGFGEAPKFPRSSELAFLLRYWVRTHNHQALEMVTVTLDHLARGGIHDQLGGGFHRYSTDAQWLVPHFEKMLYDQALLALAYLEGYRVTKRPMYAEVAHGIFDYVLRDLADPAGGFCSAEDADSEGVEGKCYVWTPAEIMDVLGPEEGELFNRFYGGSILHQTEPESEALHQRLATSRRKLLAARAQRIRPHRDDKILTSWNGLMIAALAYGASTFDASRYRLAASRAAEFLIGHLWQGQTTLQRRYRDGEARFNGTLQDYAFFAYGLLELYDATFESRWLDHAHRLTTQMIDQFWDEEGGGFFLRSKLDEPLIARSKEIDDGATPSGNSMALTVLFKLGRLMADARLESLARRALAGFASPVAQAPFSHPQLLCVVDLALGPSREIVIAANPPDASAARILGTLHERFLPRTVSALHPTAGRERQAIEALVPYLKGYDMVKNQPAAYVCTNYVCQLPTTDPAALATLLDAS